MTVSFDKLPKNLNLALYLPFADADETPAAGDLTHDFAKPIDPTTLAREQWHTFTLAGGTIAWSNLVTGQPYLEFTRATPDYLSCVAANSNDLDFLTEDFSGGMWIYPDAVAGATSYYLFSRGLVSVDGWAFYFTADVLTFETNQTPAATQVTTSAAAKIAAAGWYLVGFSRDGAATRIYVNGVDVTSVAGNHVNPTTAPRVCYIGADDTPGNGFDGKMSTPMIWAEKALSTVEWYQVYLAGRKMFGL